MPGVPITFANGRQVAFLIDEDGVGPPCFLLSVRKCGSSITNNICRRLALLNRRCFVEVGDILFRHNLAAKDWQHDPALRSLIRPRVIYGGFRDAPIGLFEDPTFVVAPKLLMIRDPRDALVSEYFSSAYSHPVPAPMGEFDATAKGLLAGRARALAEGIERFVPRAAKGMAWTMEQYSPVLSMPNVKIVRYEDVIFQKHELIANLASQFDLRATSAEVANILKWADVLPAEENPRAFIRQVRPGDHVRKLDQGVIDTLNDIFATPMKLFGYAA
jgi:hypothetical protein